MECLICESSLIEGGDHDIIDDPDHSIVTNCPDCGALVLVYWEIDK